MKTWFLQLPVRYKLRAIVLLSCSIALVVVMLVAFWSQWYLVRKQLAREVRTLATVVAEHSSAGIASDDRAALQALLQSLTVTPTVAAGQIFNANGELVAEVENTPLLPQLPDNQFRSGGDRGAFRFIGSWAEIRQPVHRNGARIGSLRLLISVREMYCAMLLPAALMAGALLLGLAVAMFVSRRLLAVVTTPIGVLSQIMDQVSREKNYALRSPLRSRDELGLLSTGMNDMLTQLQQQEQQVTEEVEGRTRGVSAAREAAAAVNRAESAFPAGRRHEIRAPIHAIIGLVRSALDNQPDAKQEKLLCSIKRSADSVLAALDDSIDVAQIEDGQLQLHTRPFVLRQLVEAVFATMHGAATEKGVHLRYIEDEELPPVLIGDDFRLRQIFSPLVSNAVKGTDTGEVTIRINADQQCSGTAHCVLHCSVSDNGIGLTPDQQACIFDSSATAEGGLGLSASRKLVELMGGRMWVESARGIGSTFHFVVTLEQSAAQGQEAPAGSSQQREVPRVARDHAEPQGTLSAGPLPAMDSGGQREPLPATVGQIRRFFHDSGHFTPAQIERLLNASLKSVAELLANCTRSVRTSEYQELARAAHTLKGTLLQCGLLQWSEYAQLLSENAEKESDQGRLAEYLAVLHIGLNGLLGQKSGSRIEATAQGTEEPVEALLRKRILVMDDDAFIRDVAGGMLAYLGYDCDLAENGEEGVAMYARALDQGKPYGLVISDLQVVGGKGGQEMASEILAFDAAARILASSGDPQSQMMLNYAEYGFCGTLHKPYSVQSFSAALAEIFDSA